MKRPRCIIQGVAEIRRGDPRLSPPVVPSLGIRQGGEDGSSDSEAERERV